MSFELLATSANRNRRMALALLLPYGCLLQVATDGQDELIEFKYFIDNIDQVDVYLSGSRPFHRECLAAFETL